MEYLIWFGWSQAYAFNELYDQAVEFVEHEKQNTKEGNGGKENIQCTADLWSPLSCVIVMEWLKFILLDLISLCCRNTRHVTPSSKWNKSRAQARAALSLYNNSKSKLQQIYTRFLSSTVHEPFHNLIPTGDFYNTLGIFEYTLHELHNGVCQFLFCFPRLCLC